MAHQDLDEVIRRIDGAFGAGYAKAHPELVAALVQAARVRSSRAGDRGAPGKRRLGVKSSPHRTEGIVGSNGRASQR